MNKSLSVLSGLALLALVKRNGVGSLTSAKSEKISNKQYFYRILLSPRVLNSMSNKTVVGMREPVYPINAFIPNTSIEIDITNIYHIQSLNYSPSWSVVFEFRSDNPVIFLTRSYGSESDILNDLFGVIYKEYVWYGIKDKWNSVSKEWQDWEMNMLDWCGAEFAKDPRHIKDPMGDYDLFDFDHDSWIDIEPLSQEDRQHNENIWEEKKEEYRKLFPEPYKYTLDLYLDKNSDEFHIYHLLHVLYSDRTGRFFAPEVREMSSKVITEEIDEETNQYLFVPIDTKTGPKLRKR